MNRRAFLKNTLATTALYSAGGLPGLSSLAQASFAPVGQRTLVNIKLDGGPDFRHLLAPAFDANSNSFGYNYWQAMSTVHGVTDSASAWEQRFNSDYAPVSSGEHNFGILNSCGWLKQMWDQGNVAIISNVFGSSSRNHAFASLVLDQGDRSSGPSDSNRSGWGGRLAAATDSKVLALTRTPRPFCFGPHPSDPNNHSNDWLIPAQDIRDMQLFRPEPGTNVRDSRAVMTRALNGYYAAKRDEMPANSVYKRFVDMHQQLTEFGEPLEDRLASLPIPQDIAALYDQNNPSLSSSYFGLQIRNLYDALAMNDIFGMRVASLEYNGFDTHESQLEALESRLQDIFGANKGLDALWQNLPTDARSNTVFCLAGEFGRQIRANGDGGTDHGEGTYVILIGEDVNGGVYGDMFPETELARMSDNSPQIEGQTAIEQVFGRVCDWMQPGAGDVVFPDRQTAPIEAQTNLSGLLI